MSLCSRERSRSTTTNIAKMIASKASHAFLVALGNLNQQHRRFCARQQADTCQTLHHDQPPLARPWTPPNNKTPACCVDAEKRQAAKQRGPSMLCRSSCAVTEYASVGGFPCPLVPQPLQLVCRRSNAHFALIAGCKRSPSTPPGPPCAARWIPATAHRSR